MKNSCQAGKRRVQALLDITIFGLLCMNLPVLLAQSSVTITVEDTHGKAVPNVKVVGRRVEKKNGEEEPVGDLLSPSKSEGKTYTISGLTKGKYKFYACEPDLKFEPDYKKIRVGDNESGKFALILKEQPTTLKVDDPEVKPASKVCLVHEETECSAVKVLSPSREIESAGVRSHYRVEELEQCKTD